MRGVSLGGGVAPKRQIDAPFHGRIHFVYYPRNLIFFSVFCISFSPPLPSPALPSLSPPLLSPCSPDAQKTVLITTAEVEARIRQVFQETLLGPASYASVDADFATACPIEDR